MQVVDRTLEFLEYPIVNDGARWMEQSRKSNAFIGRPIERIEDLRLLRGRGQYVGDLAATNVLHAMVLRSNIAHGLIRRIDASRARARPGVHAIITAQDIARALPAIPVIPMRQEPTPQLKPYEQPVIAHGKVRYVGEPLALVVAESAALAEDALEDIEVEIEPLAAVVDRATARSSQSVLFEATGSNLAITVTAVRGDADAAFKHAPYLRRERFTVQRHAAVPLEPRGLLAEWDAASERISLWGAAKVPFNNRRILAKMLAVPEHSVRLVECDVGGGFGARGEF